MRLPSGLRLGVLVRCQWSWVSYGTLCRTPAWLFWPMGLSTAQG